MSSDPGRARRTDSGALSDLIFQALGNETLSVRDVSHDTSGVLKRLSQAGLAYQHKEGPFPGRIITHRSRPEFLVLPIANTPDYLQAMARHAAEQAAMFDDQDVEAFEAELSREIDATG